MSIDLIRTRSRGSILPIALILMAFATTVLVAAGIMMQRTSNRLNSYSLLSDLRVTTSNLVEGATMVLASQWRTEEFDNQWNGYEEFVDFVSSRGGYEGDLWSEALNTLDPNGWWILNGNSEFDEILNDDAFAEYEGKGAAINSTGGKYSIVSWAEKNGVKRYSYGFAITESLSGKAALIFGETDRVFYEVTTYIPKQGGPNATETIQGFGDLINGAATVVGTVTVSATDINLEQVFQFGLEANNVLPEYDSYNYTKTASDADLVFMSLLEEHEAWLDSLTRTATITFPNPVLPVTESNYLVPVVPNDSSGNDFTISFPTVNEISPNASGYFDLSYKIENTTHTIRIPEADHQVNIILYGNLKIGEKTSSALKLSSVNGKYSITVVEGNIELNTHLVYGDFHEELDEATEQNGVVMNKPIMTWSKVKEILDDFASRTNDDYLSLKTIGGDIIVTYLIGNDGKATHGVRALSGDFAAFPSSGSGGGFLFPDLGDVIVNNNGHKAGQLFTFGSITARDFGTADQLDDIDNFFVSSPQSTLVGGTDIKRLVLLGLRAW
ncbi:MAG TPA: hypothetical protein ENN47_03030 [Mesotoga infera]|uniref:Uncharacterized protein n=1 Tax=Mesotoga infera TaxID=1236046 RepID=A0A7C1CT01_9BACT|nr:hypothetical protein [Mesotoga infera]